MGVQHHHFEELVSFERHWARIGASGWSGHHYVNRLVRYELVLESFAMAKCTAKNKICWYLGFTMARWRMAYGIP